MNIRIWNTKKNVFENENISVQLLSDGALSYNISANDPDLIFDFGTSIKPLNPEISEIFENDIVEDEVDKSVGKVVYNRIIARFEVAYNQNTWDYTTKNLERTRFTVVGHSHI